jgi:DNA-binding MarR family transcriptional regulator
MAACCDISFYCRRLQSRERRGGVGLIGDENRCRPENRLELKHNFGLQFKKINNLFIQMQNQHLKQSDVSYQQGALLMYLSKMKDHEVSQKEISEVLRIKHTTVIGLLERLEEKGMIARTVNPGNKRYRVITLTEKGQREVDHIWTCISRNEERIVGFMSEEEKDTLERLLDKVYANIENVIQEAEETTGRKE